MDWKIYLETNENVLFGKPVVKGTRLSIEHIIKLFAFGWSEQQIHENYPRLTKESLQAVFAYIQDIMKRSMNK